MVIKMYKLTKWFYIVAVSLALAAVVNLVIFFTANIIIAPEKSNEWIDFYFGKNDGLLFVIVTLVIAAIASRWTKNLNIVKK